MIRKRLGRSEYRRDLLEVRSVCVCVCCPVMKTDEQRPVGVDGRSGTPFSPSFILVFQLTAPSSLLSLFLVFHFVLKLGQ